jgi:hypothetical protein
MDTVRTGLLYFVSFGAMLAMFGSMVGIGLWLLKSAWRLDSDPRDGQAARPFLEQIEEFKVPANQHGRLIAQRR